MTVGTLRDPIRIKLSKDEAISVQLAEISVPNYGIWGTLIGTNKTLI